MSRMAAELAFIPQALSEGKNETRGDGSATNNYSSSTLCLCVPERERDMYSLHVMRGIEAMHHLAY